MVFELRVVVIADRASLSGAVELSNGDAVDFVKLAVIPGHERGTRRESDPQARQVHGVPRWRLGENDEHLRDAAKERQALLANKLQHGSTSEFPDRIKGGTPQHRGQHRAHKAIDVTKRGRAEKPIRRAYGEERS